MSIHRHRASNTYTAKRLRRARRLYVRLCSPAIWESTDNTVLHRMICRMKDSGLYAIPDAINWRDGRYRILRMLWRQYEGGYAAHGHWFFWLKKNGFDNNFNRNLNVSKSA